LEEIRYSP